MLLLQPWKIVTNAIHGEHFWSQRVHGGTQEDKLSWNSGYQVIVADELKSEFEFSVGILYTIFLRACFFGRYPFLEWDAFVAGEIDLAANFRVASRWLLSFCAVIFVGYVAEKIDTFSAVIFSKAVLDMIDAVQVKFCVGDGLERLRGSSSALGVPHGFNGLLYLLHYDVLLVKTALLELLKLLLCLN